MENQLNPSRLKAVYRMLIGLANGNLACRMSADIHDGRSHALTVALNALAEIMQQSGYMNPYHQVLKAEADDAAAAMVSSVQQYIRDHLEDPLPSAKELARQFGTNEFTLKDNFRQLLGTSLYRYYNDQRLARAHRLIGHTAVPLKEIAFMCGFNDYTNFFKAFRKKYGYTPNKVSRTAVSGSSRP